METRGSRFVPTRRAFLGGLAAWSAAAVARAEGEGEAAPSLSVEELRLPGERQLARRALLLTPTSVKAGERLPILVLLHGLGETWDETVGAHAWNDRYGLSTADARLRSPPLAPPVPSKYLSEARLARINGELSARSYRGAILVCPFTPNIHHLSPEAPALDRYADWVEKTLLPAVRERTPAREDAAGTAIDGCSLGGYMALGVFLRKPTLFGAVGTVQPAIGEKVAPIYAELVRRTLAEHGPRAIHIETSSWDPEMVAHEALSRRLKELRVPHDYAVLPGGHDQIFLREVGTLEMLLWHDRRFGAGTSESSAPPDGH